MSVWKLSILAIVLGFLVGFGLLAPRSEGTGPISTDVRWSIEDTTVHATVTKPRHSEGRGPAVLFVAGSGPTSRDWTSPLLEGENGSARLLAEVLAERGYVTLRYDKRTTGPDAMPNILKLTGKISMASHLAEVASAVKFLAARSDVDPSRIYILTSSEGAIHALNYVRGNPDIPLAGMILTGAPGRTIGAVAETQVGAILSRSEDAEALLASYKQAVDAFLVGKEMVVDPKFPVAVQQVLGALAAPVNQPFVRELWALDIAPWLAEVTIPTLVVIGKKDIQVDWQLDGQPLEVQAARNPAVSFAYPEDANHVLKYEPKAREALTPADVATYNLPSQVLDPETVTRILEWLHSQDS
ncbi:MAG: alpha/beta fold hydrolase [Candidatus Bipolaricaulis sp.]|nr:alpha/beta fold hydrolase [Candidatus Bipolaricaulis sp.]